MGASASCTISTYTTGSYTQHNTYILRMQKGGGRRNGGEEGGEMGWRDGVGDEEEGGKEGGVEEGGGVEGWGGG